MRAAMSRALGITQSKACPDMSLWQELFTTTCDWKVASLGWMYTLFFVLLGVSAAIWGGWLERVGPRKAGVVAAFCWGGGLLIGAFGVYVHQLWIMWLGSGIVGGVGLGRTVLGLRRYSARLGRVEDAGERGQDILIAAELAAGARCRAPASVLHQTRDGRELSLAGR